MVTCSQCKTQNPPGLDICQSCRADLLPYPVPIKRIWPILRAALVGLFIIAIGLVPLFIWQNESYFLRRNLAILVMLAGLLTWALGLSRALRPAPLYVRYLERAARHAGIDPPQALADFVHGVMLAPARARPALSRQIPVNLKDLIARSGNTLAAATSGYQSPEGIRKIVYSAYTTWAGLVEQIPRPVQIGPSRVNPQRVRKQVVNRLDFTFNDLAGSDLVLKLGYCPRCKAVVSCDPGGRCTWDSRHGPAKGIVYVIPEEVELFKKRLHQSFSSS